MPPRPMPVSGSGATFMHSPAPSNPRPLRLPAALAGMTLAVLLVTGAPGGPAAAPASARSAPVTSILDEPAFTRGLTGALEALYDLRMETAERRLGELAASYPGHPVEPLLAEALPLWWRLQLDTEDRSLDERLVAALEEVIGRSKARLRRDRHDADATFMMAAALALRGRVRSLRGDWIAAAWDGKRALGLVRELEERQPDNPDLGFGLGLYDYVADVAPKKYAIFRPLKPFFPAGDRTRGVATLEDVMESGRFARSEAAWALAQVAFFLERDREASLRYAAWLRERHPENAVYHTFERRVRLRWGECGAASALSREILDRHAAGRFGYNELRAAEALYALGRCAMVEGRWKDALVHFDRLETVTAARPDSAFFALAHLRQGMSLDALGRRAEAERHYRRTLTLPETSKSHAKARRFLREPYAGEEVEKG